MKAGYYGQTWEDNCRSLAVIWWRSSINGMRGCCIFAIPLSWFFSWFSESTQRILPQKIVGTFCKIVLHPFGPQYFDWRLRFPFLVCDSVFVSVQALLWTSEVLVHALLWKMAMVLVVFSFAVMVETKVLLAIPSASPWLFFDPGSAVDNECALRCVVFLSFQAFMLKIAMVLLVFSSAVMNLLSAILNFLTVPWITESAPFGKVFWWCAVPWITESSPLGEVFLW